MVWSIIEQRPLTSWLRSGRQEETRVPKSPLRNQPQGPVPRLISRTVPNSTNLINKPLSHRSLGDTADPNYSIIQFFPDCWSVGLNGNFQDFTSKDKQNNAPLCYSNILIPHWYIVNCCIKKSQLPREYMSRGSALCLQRNFQWWITFLRVERISPFCSSHTCYSLKHYNLAIPRL